MSPYTFGDAGTYTTETSWSYSCEGADTTSIGDSWQRIKYIKPMIYNLEKKIIGTINYKTNDSNLYLVPNIKYGKWDKDGWYSDASCTSATYGWDEGAGDWTTYEKWCSSSPPVVVDPSDRLREMIRQRQAPTIIVPNRRKAMRPTTQLNELRARATLRRGDR